MLPTSAPGEFKDTLMTFEEWNAESIKNMAQMLAGIAVELWYG
jgi:hypothetical protein